MRVPARPRRVIYGKIGRSVILDPKKWGPVGGDQEPAHLLYLLAARHPDVEFVVGGRYAVAKEQELPPNIVLPELPKMRTRNRYVKGIRHFDGSINPWEDLTAILRPYFMEDGDHVQVLMWAGQMGTSNVPIPRIENRAELTEPQDSFMNYVAPITLNINVWRDVDPLAREEVWVQSDVRNYLKCREVKWPPRLPIVSQFDQDRKAKHERWGDARDPADCGFDAEWVPEGGVWLAPHRYEYTGLEVIGIPDTWHVEYEHGARNSFGILINESRSNVALDRPSIVRDWVVPLGPDWIVGKWTEAGAETAGIPRPQPCHHSEVGKLVGSVRSTFMTPGSGSRWPTMKAHESFRVGTICFMHPEYDGQGHIVPTRKQLDAGAWTTEPNLRALAEWLRPNSPEELAGRVRAVDESPETYEWLRDAQLDLESRYIAEERGLCTIETRLGLR